MKGFLMSETRMFHTGSDWRIQHCVLRLVSCYQRWTARLTVGLEGRNVYSSLPWRAAYHLHLQYCAACLEQWLAVGLQCFSVCQVETEMECPAFETFHLCAKNSESSWESWGWSGSGRHLLKKHLHEFKSCKCIGSRSIYMNQHLLKKHLH